MATALKSLSISAPGTTFRVALYEGAEPSALVHAVAARLGFAFFLTQGPGRSGVVVPLTTALPDGAELTAHEATAAPPAVAIVDGLAPLLAATAGQSLMRASAKSPELPLAAGRRQNLPGADDKNAVMWNARVADAAESPAGRARAVTAPSDLPESPTRDPELQRPLLPESTRSPRVGGFRRMSTSFDNLRSLVNGDLFNKMAADEGDRSPRSELNNKTAQMCDAVQRFNRLSTDLANERTLLAWVRTCLAAIRTVFTYLVLHTLSTQEHWSLRYTELSMSVLIVVCAFTGANRYYQLKSIILQKDIVAEGFGRLSMRPLNVIVILTSITTALGVISQQWVH